MDRSKNSRTLIELLEDGETISGKDILLFRTDHENHFRCQLELLSLQFRAVLKLNPTEDNVLRDSLNRLQLAYADPKHYGDNRPDSHFANGTPTVPTPRFSYLDFIGFAVTGEGGFEGFTADIGLHPSVDWMTVLSVVGLLLIDSAVTSLEKGDVILAASESLQAAEVLEELVAEGTARSAVQRARRDFARAGGMAANRETAEYKSEVLKEWQTGRFKGNKSAAARWALKQFPLPNQEVVRRWIRDHEKVR